MVAGPSISLVSTVPALPQIGLSQVTEHSDRELSEEGEGWGIKG